MEAELVSRPAFSVVGMQYRGTMGQNNEISGLWDRFTPWAGEIQSVINPAVFYGVVGNFDDATGQFDYVAGLEVDGNPGVLEGMVRMEIPAQTYAVIRTTLPALHDTMHEIYHGWMPQSGYQRAPGPEFELYDEQFNPEDPAAELFMYIPVAR